jgi:NADH-quinone oxidoreductase subunit K
MIELHLFLTISAALFSLGIYGVLTRRNAIGVLLSVELMANAVNLNLVAFAYFLSGANGMAFTLFAIALTVTEVAVGLAIVVLLYRTRRNVLINLANELNS